MHLARALFISCLALALPAVSYGAASVNIPLDDSVVRDLERLEIKGLVKSGMLSTRPLSRTEAARLAAEAEGEYASRRQKPGSQAGRIIKRLYREFHGEVEGYASGTYVKPLEKAYVDYLYSGKTPYFRSVNNNGDFYSSGSNTRAGIWLSARLGDSLALSLNPEYRLDEQSTNVRLNTGYIAAGAGNFSLLLGKDSMWWGSGRHGALLMTDNVEPLEMVKASSDRPFLLPWIFGRLGLFKPTVFLARLETERGPANPNLLGMRLDFKPTERFQIGFNRVFMFGGEGRRSLSASEWLKIFIASDSSEHSDSPINGNQIASIDASYVYVSDYGYLPFSGIKLYTEWGAEDSSGDTKTPTGRANMYGAYIDEPFWLSDVDFRVEWANTARNARYGPTWYKHSVYKSGYTVEGRVIGHHMGSDSNDLFVRGQYHAWSNISFGVDYDKEVSGVHSAEQIQREWLGVDIYYSASDGFELSGGIGCENSTPDPNNYVAWAKGQWQF